MTEADTTRQEADRRVREGPLRRLVRRPEIGSFSGMVVILVFLAIVAGDVVYNPLGIKTTCPSFPSSGSSRSGPAC